RRSRRTRNATHPCLLPAALDPWLRRYDRRRPRFRVELGDGESLGDSAFMIVSNQRPWAYLGKRPLMLAPHAGLDVPLTVTLFRSIGLATVLGGAAAALNGGQRLVQHPEGFQRPAVRALTAVGDGPLPPAMAGHHLPHT